MFKLRELSDGDKKPALVLPLHMPNLNQWSPFSALNPQSEPRVVKHFQPKSVHLNINGTRARVHYDNSAQLHELSACLSPLRPGRRGSVSCGCVGREASLPVAPSLPLRPQKVVCRALATSRNQLIIASTSEWWTTFIYHLTDQWPHCHRANVSLLFQRDQSREPPRNIYAEDARPVNIISKRQRRGALRPTLTMATEQVTTRAPSIAHSTPESPRVVYLSGRG